MVTAVVTILLALSAAIYSSASKAARASRETSSGRTLITAFLSYAADRDGTVMPAIDKSAGGSKNPVPYPPENRNVTFMEAPHRYPFRLAPYFGFRMKETLLINGLDKKVEQIFGKKGPMHDYGVSLCPAFGINYFFCGGYVEPSGSLDYPSQRESVTRMAQAEYPILVFASAGGKPDEKTYLEGYFKIESPVSSASPWSSKKWTEEANPADYGGLDARHNGKVICAFLDGSVRVLGIEELRDMRLWSRNAAMEDLTDYRPVQ